MRVEYLLVREQRKCVMLTPGNCNAVLRRQLALCSARIPKADPRSALFHAVSTSQGPQGGPVPLKILPGNKIQFRRFQKIHVSSTYRVVVRSKETDKVRDAEEIEDQQQWRSLTAPWASGGKKRNCCYWRTKLGDPRKNGLQSHELKTLNILCLLSTTTRWVLLVPDFYICGCNVLYNLFKDTELNNCRSRSLNHPSDFKVHTPTYCSNSFFIRSLLSPSYARHCWRYWLQNNERNQHDLSLHSPSLPLGADLCSAISPKMV
ncbi:PREDICTED: uncharacterized protein LOC109373100 [Hipposideros armiger]|uniref:Uncharacterized protein LOC109373100 n=1 Tax=Hipposideros armiger TaxID=186990 RepID=A0A8B7Q3Y8_HIPAR|nr:PREDICTED: uncharacterized protein LOC109373100 [Hipposideros armiger]